MKKALSLVLLLSLIFSLMVIPSYAAVDTSTSATTKAPTATKAPDAAPVDTTKAESYTVVSGDVFWKIAKKHNLTVEALAKLNPQVKNINKLKIGDKLVVKAK